MNLQQIADECNQHFARMGVDYHRFRNIEGLVCRPEPGRNPPAVRMGSGLGNAVYIAEMLLDYLRCLQIAPKDRVMFWDSGQFWKDLRTRNLEMLDPVGPVRQSRTREVKQA